MKKIFTFISILLILAIFIGGIYIIKLRSNNQVISFSHELFLVVEDIVIEDGEPVFLEDNEIYFNIDVVKQYIDPDIFYDEAEEMVIVTDKSRVRRYKVNDNVASVNSKDFLVDNPVIFVGGKVYIPMGIYEDYPIKVDYYPDTNAVVMDYTDIYYLDGDVILEGGNIRTDLDKKAPILVKDLEIGTKLNVYGEYEQWYKVRTVDGIVGFIEKKYLRLNHTKDIYKSQLVEGICKE